MAVAPAPGYVGRGERNEVFNGSVYHGEFNDTVMHPDGRKFRGHAAVLIDVTPDPPTVRAFHVFQGLKCIGSRAR